MGLCSNKTLFIGTVGLTRRLQFAEPLSELLSFSLLGSMRLHENLMRLPLIGTPLQQNKRFHAQVCIHIQVCPPRHGFSSKKLDVLGIHLWIQIKNSRCFLTESLCKDLLDALGQPFFKKNKKRIILFLLNSHQKLTRCSASAVYMETESCPRVGCQGALERCSCRHVVETQGYFGKRWGW